MKPVDVLLDISYEIQQAIVTENTHSNVFSGKCAEQMMFHGMAHSTWLLDNEDEDDYKS